MTDHTSQYRPRNPDIDRYDETLTDRRLAPYRFGQSARTDSHREDPVPLFLSDYDGEPDPNEYMTPLRKGRRSSVSLRILLGVSATAVMGILFALFSSDATRDIIANAKASITAAVSAPSAAAQPEPSQLAASDVQLNDPARQSAPANQTAGVRTVTTVAVAPTRGEITTAYQSALQSRAPVAAAPVAATPVAAPPARKLDADELATLMNRAKLQLAAGDIPSARLLLERAADAQDANATLMLARTYDPEVLGTKDARNVMPDPAMARAWYQKAARFGSSDAQRRLAQLPD